MDNPDMPNLIPPPTTTAGSAKRMLRIRPQPDTPAEGYCSIQDKRFPGMMRALSEM